MRTEESMLPTGLSHQSHGRDGILLPSEVFQTRVSAYMPVPLQPPGISVALIENDPQTSQVLSDWIKPAEGFSLFSHHKSAEHALAALPTEKPSIVLMDINLPGIGAITCLHQLKPILQQTQFVMLMVDENAEKIFDSLAVGATGYLLAQTPRSELLASLKHIHAGGSPMSGVIAKKVLQSFQLQPPASAAELSPRENRILRLLASGCSENEAAGTLNISLPMVSTYIRSIYEKLHLHLAGKILHK